MTIESPRRQRGAALLLVMLVVMMAAAAVLVGRLSGSGLQVARDRSTTEALHEARQALLDYAAIQPDLNPGAPPTLPCPDVDDSGSWIEGEAHATACGASGETVLGRLPWRTLDLPVPNDSSAACLWYVVSGSWKDADAATATLINSDSNGQLRLWSIDRAQFIAGIAPAERWVAAVLAPMATLAGQNRSTDNSRFCSDDFNAADFLEADAGSGFSNASLSGGSDTVDVLLTVVTHNDDFNDRIAGIDREAMARVVSGRADFAQRMRDLGLAVTRCVAAYAQANPGGTTDRRLSWPAPLTLADYRPDAAYDDVVAGLSGRLSDVVDDSNAQTGNPTGNQLSNCSAAAVPEWTAEMQATWSHWKDHFFLVLAESFAPDAPVPSTCGACLTVNGGGAYAAVVIFAGSRLDALAQSRDAPPTDTDTRGDINNYLEGINAAAFPHPGGPLDLLSQASGPGFNDRLFCIDSALSVTEC